jgi:hypothetical protein
MKKQASKFLAMLVALVMVLSTMVVPVWADPYDCDECYYICSEDGDCYDECQGCDCPPESDPDLGPGAFPYPTLTKTLRTMPGTPIPDITFYFDFELVAFNSRQPARPYTPANPGSAGTDCAVCDEDYDNCECAYGVGDATPVVPATPAIDALECPICEADYEDCNASTCTGFTLPSVSIPQQQIQFTPGMTGTETGGLYIVTESITNFFSVAGWGTGIYVFRVTEQQTATIAGMTNYSAIMYDDGSFYLHVWVNNNGLWGVVTHAEIRNPVRDDECTATTHDGTGTCICADEKEDDLNFENDIVVWDPTEPTTSTQPTDPTVPTTGPTEPTEPTTGPTEPTTGGTFPTDPSEPGEPDGSLIVGKTVTGSAGDEDMYFDFSMTLTLPSLLVGTDYLPEFLIARIVCVDRGVVLVHPSNFPYPWPTGVTLHTDGTIVINVTTSGEPPTAIAEIAFRLQHDQRLVFESLPLGTLYNVTEYYVIDYTQTGYVTIAGDTSYAIGADTATGNLVLLGSVRQILVIDCDCDECECPTPDECDCDECECDSIIHSGNSVAVVNDFSVPTPMGIFLDNLPFIGLIALSVGGLVLFLVVKTRASKRALAYQS